ncbi:MAG TPA: PASTA domain-containing protein, partial [Candidatus Hydrogenedens sp.]|nr:PASTA domain-containing protein [Candidatus Hydrogenedens sp.]
QSYPFICKLSGLIPDVRGDELSVAENKIYKGGFDYVVEEIYHNTIPAGYVIDTDPENSCYFPYGDVVTIISSKGPFPPIYISTIEELQLIGNDPAYPEDNEYHLANDIDASATREWNEGAGFIPIERFSGIFYGDGYKISGLYISNDTGYPTGLFQSIIKPTGALGRVENLIIENAEIYGIGYTGIVAGEILTPVPESTPTLQDIATSGEVFGVNSVGGLAGVIRSGISVYDCSIRANVHARESIVKISYGRLGGVCGYAAGCLLSRVSYIGTIMSDIGDSFGGIAGYAGPDGMVVSNAVFVNCYAQASIQNKNPISENIGGLIGFADVNTEVTNSYSASTFSRIPLTTGGLIGNGNTPIVVNNSYWDKDLSGVSSSFGGGTGESTENMKRQSTFVGWDFVGTWGIVEDSSYPLLLKDLMIMTNMETWYYTNAEDWLLFNGISYSLTYECNNVILPDYVISQSIAPQQWVQVFYPDPVILSISTGLCPPILMNSIDQIALIGKVPEFPLDGYYVLENNIDASDTRDWNAGAGFEPIQNFTGLFDGNGYIMSDLYINRPGEDGVGLFGFVEDSGRIRNVYIKNADITGNSMVGILVGVNVGHIQHCGVSGTVTGNDLYTGSLVGWSSGLINESFGVAQVRGTNYVGGLIGLNTSSFFMYNSYNNYFWGIVYGDDRVGGFVSYNDSYIENSYAVAEVIAVDKALVGGFCAKNEGGTISSCYWDKEYSGLEISDGGEGKTTAEMKSEATFPGWDFSFVWMINEGITYPFLHNNNYLFIEDYKGQSYNTISTFLENLGMFTNSEKRCDWVYDAGLVVENSFIGLNIPIFTNIDFVVSLGLCTTVPDVVGDTLVNAINEIHSANLVVGSVVEECNAYPLGVVFEQYPISGEVVVEGSTVALKVSLGPCPEGEGTPEGEGAVEGTPEGTLEGEGTVEGTPEGEGIVEGTPEGTPEGEGVVEGTPEGTPEGEGVVEGTPEGTPEGEGVVEGTPEGTPEGEGIVEGTPEGTPEGEGIVEGTPEGTPEGEGIVEGTPEGTPEGEGIVEGTPEGTPEGEGVVEGTPEGTPEGEGVVEGTPEGTPEGEGVVEGTPEGTPEGEGVVEGIPEGTPEGEGVVEGTPEGTPEGEGVVEGTPEGTPEGEGVVEGTPEGT